MASIAASPASFSDGLKKRGRGMISADSYDLARKKRFRGLDASGNNNTEDGANAGVPAADVPKYTQRQVDYFEQVKLAETARIKAEYEQYIMKKDVEFQQLRQELMALHQRFQTQEKDAERLSSENKLLKRAITIQNQQKEECLQENGVLKNLATQAADHIQRLEQTNYALRVHLQASTSSSSHGNHMQNPDVF